MAIQVDGRNAFYTGWLTCFLGQPRHWPGVTEPHPESEFIDLAAFFDGWDTCDQTPVDGHPNRLGVFLAELDRGNIVAYHVDDDGHEIDPVYGNRYLG